MKRCLFFLLIVSLLIFSCSTAHAIQSSKHYLYMIKENGKLRFTNETSEKDIPELYSDITIYSTDIFSFIIVDKYILIIKDFVGDGFEVSYAIPLDRIPSDKLLTDDDLNILLEP